MDMEKVLKEATQNWQDFLDTSETGYGQGLCYENAGRFVMQKREFEGSPLILCHGEVFSSKHMTRHGHAWVEWGDGVGMVLDPSTDESEPTIVILHTYYRLGMIDPFTVKRFTADELVHLLAKHHSWGPWE